jgi:hypothetical protein
MAQYDPIAVETGVPTNLRTDTARADGVAVAGLTTAGLASGDACQVSGALTLQKADCTSTSPIVGIYDGVTGSLVRSGVVVATFKVGPTTAGEAVYLSNTAGKLTNVKPTMDMLHEVGVVVDAASSRILLQPKPVIVLPVAPPLYLFLAGSGNTIERFRSSDGDRTEYTWPAALLFSSFPVFYDGSRVWVGHTSYNGIGCIDVPGGTVHDYPGNGIDNAYYAFDGTNLWVSCDRNTAPQFYKINPATGAVLDSFTPDVPPVMYGSANLCYDGAGYLWVACNSYGRTEVFRVKISDHTGLRIFVASAPHGLCVAGANVWAGCWSHVVKIRISDGFILGTYARARASGWGVCYDGTRIWQVGGGYLQRWLEADGTDLGEIDLGGTNTRSVCFDGTYIWCYGWIGGNRVVKFTTDGVYAGGFDGTAATTDHNYICTTAAVLPALP